MKASYNSLKYNTRFLQQKLNEIHGNRRGELNILPWIKKDKNNVRQSSVFFSNLVIHVKFMSILQPLFICNLVQLYLSLVMEAVHRNGVNINNVEQVGYAELI